MIYTDEDIKKLRSEGKINIEPWYEDAVQPASVDLHLDDNFLMFDNVNHALIDLKKGVNDLMRKVVISDEEPLIVHPGEFVLGTTIEKVTLGPDVIGRLEGKSSLGRIGLVVHVTAGFFDPGFSGQCTLEITNLNNMPIALYKGMKICQFSFCMATSPAKRPYGHKELGSHYHGQVGATKADLSGVMKRVTK